MFHSLKFWFIIIFCYNSLLGGNIVFVSIEPQKYFVQRIVKGTPIPVKTILPINYSFDDYKPLPSYIRDMSHGKIFFTIDLPYEKYWIKKLKEKQYKIDIIDTTVGISKLYIENSDKIDHYIWTDPILVKSQVDIIYNTLIKKYPRYRRMFTLNYQSFMAEIDNLYIRIRNIFDNVENVKFLVFDSSWRYFADRFQLKQIHIKLENRDRPTAKDLSNIVRIARREKADVIFREPYFDENAAELIAQYIQGKVEVIDPMYYNWSANILQVANKIAKQSGIEIKEEEKEKKEEK
jgi:zinc transport system substrate-binding protein